MIKEPIKKYLDRTNGSILIPAGIHPWPHELRIAEILAMAGVDGHSRMYSHYITA